MTPSKQAETMAFEEEHAAAQAKIQALEEQLDNCKRVQQPDSSNGDINPTILAQVTAETCGFT